MHPDLIRRTTTARIPTPEGTFQLRHYVDTRDGKEHLALIMGEDGGQGHVLVRVHSECFTGDVLGSQRCDCGEQLHQAMRIIAAEGRGVILYLRQEGRGIGLEAKLNAYNLQDQGMDTVDANLALGYPADPRDYGVGMQILQDLGLGKIRLLTNNPKKTDAFIYNGHGLEVVEQIPIIAPEEEDRRRYLDAKRDKMGHRLPTATPPANHGTNGHSS